MTDKELLELAAKAYWGDEIGDVCSVEWSEEDQAIAYTHGENQDHNGNDRTYLWNPLEDSGNALLLAVKLNLDIEFTANENGGIDVCAIGRWDGAPNGCIEGYEMQEDSYAATRRAIVRAAAEIGKDKL